MATAALLFSVNAHAQASDAFSVDSNIMLSASASHGDGHLTNGAGAPVVFRDARGEYKMIYETRLPQTDSRCPVGIWGLGVATSPDGINWTPDDDILLAPNPGDGSYYSCVAAHPTVSYKANLDRATVLFKAEQGSDACNSGTPSWGCDRFSGLGRVIVYFQSNGEVRTTVTTSSPIMTVGQDFGFPKLTRVGNLNFLMYSVRPAIHRTTAAGLGSFGHTKNPVLRAGGVTWGSNQLFNPSSACDDTSPTFKYWSYFGGLNTVTPNSPSVVSAGWGKAISNDGQTWFQNADPYFEWSDNDSWRHWDMLVVESGTPEYLVYHSEKDGAGRPRIRLAYTDASWDDSAVYDRTCD
jgi:hypothetical protein